MNDRRSLDTLRAIQATDFDWVSWRPGVKSTLVFVIREDQVLLLCSAHHLYQRIKSYSE